MKSGVVAFAFGTPSDIDSNRRIANIAEQCARHLSAPVYTQCDIQLGDDVSVTYTREEPGEPPPTLRIARGAVDWAFFQGIKELWISCAAPHLWRCERDLRYAVKEAGLGISVRVCGQIQQELTSWFCLEATQPRVQSLKAWRGRERILEWMPMFVYKRVAS